ncbi:MAG: hypothetical protein Q8O33_07340 [Pseudomonadota bacterium]|nr:hypothetical protein [Pseudomonadota bacterium]
MNRTAKKLLPTGQPHERQHPLEDGSVKITTFVPLQFKKRGIKKVVVGPVGVEDPVVVSMSAAAISPSQDPTLLKALARGYYWQHLLDTGTVGDAAEIAEREGLHRVTVSDALRFALLAPGIVQAALDGSLPRTMALETLQRRTIPLDWEVQRGMIERLG